MNNKKLELLAPAGSYEIFKAVLHAGADAVYVGGNRFGARAYANNFSEEELLRAIDEAHIHGRQLYLTVNTLMKEEELQELYDYLLPYYKQGLDAVIVQDIGAFSFIREQFPGLDIHTSTQMTVCNRYGAQKMKELGATRVVTAREMSFAEIKDIATNVDIEIESFVHGALCYCFSGQCLLSSMLGGRSGNRGRCAQPCRLPYEVYDAGRKKIAVEPYVLSPKDLCTIDMIPQLAESGIYSFKIEGRMKQAEYAAGVVSVYRKYMDRYLEYGADGYKVSGEDQRKLYDFGNRSGFTDGYYKKHNGKEMITFEKPNHTKALDALGASVREQFCESERKEKIKGNLILSKDLPATIEVSCGEFSYRADGDIVQAALKQPLLAEKIMENMKKTGNTPFEFDTLKLTMNEAIFLPMKSLNQLRRDALDGLSEQILTGYRRNEPQRQTVWKERLEHKDLDHNRTHLAVSVEQRSQLAAVLEREFVEAVYLDAACYTRGHFTEELAADVEQIRAAGKKAYYVCPTVFRKQTSDFYLEKREELLTIPLNGLVVKSFDALAFVKQYWNTPELIADQNMYAYNSLAIQMLRDEQISRMTAPFELNRKELRNRSNSDSEIVLYGYLPLMTSAQCVHANTGRCDKKPQITYLKDRYGKYFPVKNNCMDCYNTVYNTTPLLLFASEPELLAAGFSCFRLAFTIEREKEVRRILDVYEAVVSEQRAKLSEVYDGDYTNGHYKRGVE